MCVNGTALIFRTADEEVIVAVAIDITNGNTGAEVAEFLGNKEFAVEVIEFVFFMYEVQFQVFSCLGKYRLRFGNGRACSLHSIAVLDGYGAVGSNVVYHILFAIQPAHNYLIYFFSRTDTEVGDRLRAGEISFYGFHLHQLCGVAGGHIDLGT